MSPTALNLGVVSKHPVGFRALGELLRWTNILNVLNDALKLPDASNYLQQNKR